MTKWEIALHEAAHTVTALRLGVGVALSGIGATAGYTLYKRTDTLRAALIAAAGELGAQLASKYRAPEVYQDPEPSTRDVPEASSEEMHEAIRSAASDPAVHMFTDEDRISAWVTAGPMYDWGTREKLLTEKASAIVGQHEGLIVQLASFLLERGSLNESTLKHFQAAIA